jgi:hypothetical protein
LLFITPFCIIPIIIAVLFFAFFFFSWWWLTWTFLLPYRFFIRCFSSPLLSHWLCSFLSPYFLFFHNSSLFVVFFFWIIWWWTLSFMFFLPLPFYYIPLLLHLHSLCYFKLFLCIWLPYWQLLV